MSAMEKSASHSFEIGFVAALVVGLACMDMWPDMLGHAAGLVGVNDLFAALGLNGRFF